MVSVSAQLDSLGNSAQKKGTARFPGPSKEISRTPLRLFQGLCLVVKRPAEASEVVRIQALAPVLWDGDSLLHCACPVDPLVPQALLAEVVIPNQGPEPQRSPGPAL